MRKLLILIAVLFLAAGSAYAINYDDGTEIHLTEGSGATPINDIKVYRLVRYPECEHSTAALASGDVVIWDTVSDDGVTINIADATDISASSDAAAGVVVGSIPTADAGQTLTNSIGKDNWGYIQTYGVHAAVDVDVAGISVGEGIRAGGTATQGTGIAGSTNTRAFGFAMDAHTAGTAGTVEEFINNR